MSYCYRLEPIVNLFSGLAIGHELLAGDDTCPNWSTGEWHQWYAFLAEELPRILDKTDTLVFINISGNQLLDTTIRDAVMSLVPHAKRLVIEWTEHHFLNNEMPTVVDYLNTMKEAGFLIAIDDIGSETGIDGLGRSGSILADFCKIDGPYFQAVREHGHEYLRDLCRHLAYRGAKVIVEWIETESDYKLAIASGAHFGQGRMWKHGKD